MFLCDNLKFVKLINSINIKVCIPYIVLYLLYMISTAKNVVTKRLFRAYASLVPPTLAPSPRSLRFLAQWADMIFISSHSNLPLLRDMDRKDMKVLVNDICRTRLWNRVGVARQPNGIQMLLNHLYGALPDDDSIVTEAWNCINTIGHSNEYLYWMWLLRVTYSAYETTDEECSKMFDLLIDIQDDHCKLREEIGRPYVYIWQNIEGDLEGVKEKNIIRYHLPNIHAFLPVPGAHLKCPSL